MKRPKSLKDEELLRAYNKLKEEDKSEVIWNAGEIAIKTGITTLEGLDLLSKIGMYMVENPGVKRDVVSSD